LVQRFKACLVPKELGEAIRQPAVFQQMHLDSDKHANLCIARNEIAFDEEFLNALILG
jgi:hypothetical protein